MNDDADGRASLGAILKALAFAAHKHRDQRRKDAEASPYINHPIAVADLLCNVGGVDDTEVLCAAILHDTIEDTRTTPEELAEHFGGRVRDVVLEVTDDKRLPPAERKRLQVEHAPHISRAAQLVKLADKLSNLHDVLDHPPASWPLARRQAYFDWARAVVDGMRGVNPALETLFDEVYGRRPVEDA